MLSPRSAVPGPVAWQRAPPLFRRHPCGRQRLQRGESGVARDIARIAVGNGGLAALDQGDGLATLATCDPGTVSGPPGVSTPVSASCGINYSDGSVWRQTVTVTFNSNGNPVADWTDLGTEMLPPTAG